MSRKPADGAKTFAEKFVNTSIHHDVGIYGKMYSSPQDGCKILMNTRHRQSYPLIEMIRFPNVLLVAEPDLWDSAYQCYSPSKIFSELIQPAANVHNSREFDHSAQGAILQLGNKKYYITQIETDRNVIKIDASALTSSARKGKTLLVPIKESINKVDEAVFHYFSGGDSFVINGNILMVPSNDEEVPALSNYFSRNDLELIDNFPVMNGVFVHEESYHERFGHLESPKFKEHKILAEKAGVLRERLKERRYCEALKWTLGNLIWNPGCESISNSNNHMFIRGPWDIKGAGNRDFKKILERKWHTLYAI